MTDRYVVVGLARSRCRWFVELARWATAAVAPIEFVKCLSAEEARAVIGAGRRVSALLVDGGLPRLDRGLVEAAGEAGAPTILVGPTGSRDWEALGCATVLDEDFSRDELVDVLDRWARRISRTAERTSRRVDLQGPAPMGRLVAVLGPGGTGTSTVAMAAAQGLAASTTDTVLVDGCRRADLAMYHDVGDVIPGLPELVDLHRSDEPDPEQIRSLEFAVDGRGYRVVLGLRRPRDWAGLRPRSVRAAFDGLRRAHGAVVIDLEADLDGESDTGSVDVEDRHAPARTAVVAADTVVVVTGAGLKGLHDAARLVDELRHLGIRADRILPVVNDAPRSPGVRAQLARTLRTLTNDGRDHVSPASPVFVRRLRSLEARHRCADPLPPAIVGPVTRGVTTTWTAPEDRASTSGAQGVRIRPGDLGAGLDVGPVGGGAAGAVVGPRGRRP